MLDQPYFSFFWSPLGVNWISLCVKEGFWMLLQSICIPHWIWLRLHNLMLSCWSGLRKISAASCMLCIVLVILIAPLSRIFADLGCWNSLWSVFRCSLFPYRSIRFYTECFGMKLLRKRDIPEEKYANAFLGFGPEQSHFVVELTYSMFCSVNLLNSCITFLVILWLYVSFVYHPLCVWLNWAWHDLSPHMMFLVRLWGDLIWYWNWLWTFCYRNSRCKPESCLHHRLTIYSTFCTEIEVYISLPLLGLQIGWRHPG